MTAPLPSAGGTTGDPAVKFGTADAVVQGTRRLWTPESGERQEHSYRGVSQALKTLYDQLVQAAILDPRYEVLDFDPGRGSGLLRVSYKGPHVNTTPTPIYEMYCNEVQTPVENHPYFSSLTDAQLLDVIHRYTEQIAADSGWNAMQLALYKFYLRKMHFVTVFQFVLRESQYDAKDSTMRASWTDVNKVVTPPDTSTANKLIAAIPASDWLKRSPVVRLQVNRLWAIEQEWWGNPTADGGGWSAALYGGSATP
jgi:hypothetical protein